MANKLAWPGNPGTSLAHGDGDADAAARHVPDIPWSSCQEFLHIINSTVGVSPLAN